MFTINRILAAAVIGLCLLAPAAPARDGQTICRRHDRGQVITYRAPVRRYIHMHCARNIPRHGSTRYYHFGYSPYGGYSYFGYGRVYRPFCW